MVESSTCLVSCTSHTPHVLLIEDGNHSWVSMSLGNRLCDLGQSISFGRFMSESLDWEKWSAFTHNHYVEEAEKYSKPGSVAAKKAYFEAHYKRKAAEKASALVEEANAQANETYYSVTREGSIDSSAQIKSEADNIETGNEGINKDSVDYQVVDCDDTNQYKCDVGQNDLEIKSEADNIEIINEEINKHPVNYQVVHCDDTIQHECDVGQCDLDIFEVEGTEEARPCNETFDSVTLEGNCIDSSTQIKSGVDNIEITNGVINVDYQVIHCDDTNQYECDVGQCDIDIFEVEGTEVTRPCNETFDSVTWEGNCIDSSAQIKSEVDIIEISNKEINTYSVDYKIVHCDDTNQCKCDVGQNYLELKSEADNIEITNEEINMYSVDYQVVHFNDTDQYECDAGQCDLDIFEVEGTEEVARPCNDLNLNVESCMLVDNSNQLDHVEAHKNVIIPVEERAPDPGVTDQEVLALPVKGREVNCSLKLLAKTRADKLPHSHDVRQASAAVSRRIGTRADKLPHSRDVRKASAAVSPIIGTRADKLPHSRDERKASAAVSPRIGTRNSSKCENFIGEAVEKKEITSRSLHMSINLHSGIGDRSKTAVAALRPRNDTNRFSASKNSVGSLDERKRLTASSLHMSINVPSGNGVASKITTTAVKPRIRMNIVPKSTKSNETSMEKRPTARSVHMSINMSSGAYETSKTLSVIEHNRNKKNHGLLIPAPTNLPSQGKRTERLVNKSGVVTVNANLSVVSVDCQKSSSTAKSNPRALTRPSPFRFSIEERAMKHKELLQRMNENKSKEVEKVQLQRISKPHVLLIEDGNHSWVSMSLGNRLCDLGQSISFGRFMSESLDWEKWSAFTHNHYVEEAEKYSKPGSVAAKKAYFEAHYKRKAAEKASALVEEANAQANETYYSVTREGSIDSSAQIKSEADNIETGNEGINKDSVDYQVVDCDDTNQYKCDVGQNDLEIKSEADNIEIINEEINKHPVNYQVVHCDDTIQHECDVGQCDLDIFEVEGTEEARPCNETFDSVTLEGNCIDSSTQIKSGVDNIEITNGVINVDYQVIHCDDTNQYECDVGQCDIDIFEVEGTEVTRPCNETFDSVTWEGNCIDSSAQIKSEVDIIEISNKEINTYSVDYKIVHCDDTNQCKCDVGQNYLELKSEADNIEITNEEINMYSVDYQVVHFNDTDQYECDAGQCDLDIFEVEGTEEVARPCNDLNLNVESCMLVDNSNQLDHVEAHKNVIIPVEERAPDPGVTDQEVLALPVKGREVNCSLKLLAKTRADKLPHSHDVRQASAAVSRRIGTRADKLPHSRDVRKASAAVSPIIGTRADKLPHSRDERKASAAVSPRIGTRNSSKCENFIGEAVEKKEITSRSLHMSINLHSGIGDRSKTAVAALRPRNDTNRFSASKNSVGSLDERKRLTASSLHMSINVPSGNGVASKITTTAVKPRIRMNIVPKSTKSNETSMEKRPTARSVHMSINMSSGAYETSKTLSVIEHNRNKKNHGLLIPAPTNLPSQGKRTERLVNKSGVVTVNANLSVVSVDCQKSSSTAKSNPRALTRPSPFRFSIEERAMKHKELLQRMNENKSKEVEKVQLQRISKDKTEHVHKKQQQSSVSKSKPNDDMPSRAKSPSNQIRKVSVALSRPPKSVRKASSSTIKNSGNSWKPPINIGNPKCTTERNNRTRQSGTSLSNTRRENDSPNIQH